MHWFPRYVVLCAAALFLVTAVSQELADRGVDLRDMRGTLTDVRIDVTIPIAESFALVATADRAAARVQEVFGRHFMRRPRIAVFGSTQAFARGARSLFGYSTEDADRIAMSYGGLFDRRSFGIAVDEDADRDESGGVLEHELVHQMVREMTRSAELPTWFEEGIATAVARADQQSDESLAEESIEGRAVAASGLTSFAELATLDGWQTAYARIGEEVYDESAEAVRWMEGRLGWTGLLGVLDATGGGEPFAHAYARNAGQTLASLEGELDASASTALLVHDPHPGDRDVVWVVFTGIPFAEVPVRITGPRAYEVTFTILTDRLGMFRGSFGSTAPPGSYLVRAAGLEALIETDR